jgi:SPP1 gp7 family putative phage head morphogenesis protein
MTREARATTSNTDPSAKLLGSALKKIASQEQALHSAHAALDAAERKLRSSQVTQKPSGYNRTAMVKLNRNLNATIGTTDAKPPKQKPPKTGRAEQEFNAALQGVAKQVGNIVSGYEFNTEQIIVPVDMLKLLRAYAQALRPWAVSAVKRMLGEVDSRDRDSWRSLGQSISSQLRKDLRSANVGGVLRALMGEQVELIQSLPLEAAERVHKLAIRGLLDSGRAREIAEEIELSGEVTASRATLIARTEVARTASVLTQTRALQAGLTHYRWQTSKDADVRQGHRDMQGQICEFANPPAVNENGRIMYHHPGQIWNCRCWPEPIVPLE